MASQSLYRKWRSQTFDELVGQEPIIQTLKNALVTGNLSHAYLFTGPRGTGKTSTARLLAKTVNCLNPRDGEPCNVCEQCREITSGASFNVIEIDAASNRGIDSIRELREKVMVPPASGKYKIYILDEAHMLTTEAFNALLKTLEEPPDYAIFVMATTDVHKMLPTVLSRCQRFDFKRISTRQIVNHLLFVAKEEHVELERSAAELIARSAAGGMRDALSLFDQAIAYSGETISLAQVQSMLGVADPRAISKLITHIADFDGAGVLHLIHELAEAGADLRQLNAQVVEYWRALMLAKAGADVATILDLTEEEAKEIAQLTPRFNLEELTECARIFAQNELIQKNQGTPQLGLELAALESIEAHRRGQNAQPLVAARERPAAAQAPANSSSSVEQPVQRSNSSAPRPAAPACFQEPEVASAPASTPAPATQESPALADASSSTANSAPTLTVANVTAAWANVRKRTRQRSKSGMLAANLSYFEVVGIEGSATNPVVIIQAAGQTQYKYVKDAERYKDIEWALSLEFGVECQVRLLPPGQTPPAPLAASYSTTMTAPQPSVHLERPAPSTPLADNAAEFLNSTEQPAGNTLSSLSTSPGRGAPAGAPVPPPTSLPGRGAPAGAPSETAVQQPPPVSLPTLAAENNKHTEPLARSNIVRENKSTTVSQSYLEQRVQHDPVVQEVLRTFSATVVEIRPK